MIHKHHLSPIKLYLTWSLRLSSKELHTYPEWPHTFPTTSLVVPRMVIEALFQRNTCIHTQSDLTPLPQLALVSSGAITPFLVSICPHLVYITGTMGFIWIISLLTNRIQTQHISHSLSSSSAMQFTQHILRYMDYLSMTYDADNKRTLAK